MKKNIIHSVQVEINTTSLATANAIKGTINDVIKNEVFPRIERLLEQYQIHLGADQSLQIEALELDVNLKENELNSPEMVSTLVEQLEKSLHNLQKQKPFNASNNSNHYFSKHSLNKHSSNEHSSNEHSLNEHSLNERYLFDAEHPYFSTSDFSTRSLTNPEKNLESLFFFVRTGTKPWWIPSGDALKEVLKQETLSAIIHHNKTEFSQRFLIEIQRASSRKRVISQFSDEILIQLIHQSFSVLAGKEMNAQNLAKISQIIRSGSNEHFRNLVWNFILIQLIESSTGTSRIELKPLIEIVLTELTKKEIVFSTTDLQSESLVKNSVEPIVRVIFAMRNKQTEIPPHIKTEIRTLLDELFQKKEIQNSTQISKNTSKTSKKTAQIEVSEMLKSTENAEEQKQVTDPVRNKKANGILPEGLHFDHAGLVLLYPFLGHFFKHIELMDTNQKLIDPELAAHVLHYIATGKENDWEFELVFEKYIVGIPVNEPISKNRVITEEVKNEVNSMLQAVKDNWAPLSNSSNELLRYEFLQRPGKLMIDGQQQRIVMEKKTQDILLNKLTWTMSIVRFPWRDELLYVEW